jgi:hypothetical protein
MDFAGHPGLKGANPAGLERLRQASNEEFSAKIA